MAAERIELIWRRYVDSEEGSAEEFVAVEELRVIAERAEAAEQAIRLIAKAMGMVEYGDSLSQSIQADDAEIVEAVQQLRAWQYEHQLCVEAGAARTSDERAEQTEAELAQLRERLEALVEKWRRMRDSMEGTGQADALGVCADELLEAAEGKP